MKNLEKLKQVYAKNLELARSRYPNDYAWPLSELPKVLERMNKAIDVMSFNKDSHAWRMTCKELGLQHTYKSIAAYIGEHNEK